MNGHAYPSQLGMKQKTPVAEALSDHTILSCIVGHFERNLDFLGRAQRQATIAQLALVSKAWVEPVNKCIYR